MADTKEKGPGNTRPLQLWHSTTDAAATAILREGFRDSSGFILVGVAQELTGVFVSNVPLDVNEGAKGDTRLLIELDASEAELAKYEIVNEDCPYREWLTPAALLNTRSRVRRATDKEETAAKLERFAERMTAHV